MDLLIFWNHVGREHGGLEYAPDIRKNSPSVIQSFLEQREQLIRSNAQPHRFVRHDESTLLELPPLNSKKKFIIVYLIDEGLQFSLNFKTRYPWWLIDIVDVQELKPDVFCVYDLFIDISVHPDGSYHVFDIDEFEEAIRLGVLTPEQVSRSLKSFHCALNLLNTKKFTGEWLDELKEKYM
ncbi:DUF402 domain-containing protein [Planomicrobium sp. CPCC 101110]|uniref:DUF402 domain-containing protein n=1 Tax=Planomicrobium sp. CPCC 101110 TaxID=2599619 RepID=UPI0011B584B0|nr:DUF402 domain-containing protein [Planomicrobium sp. CPCC 101110]TWT25344.1 hypothetical protein FQV30_13360 [Planomicrobium sp. CPCC 101110]